MTILFKISQRYWNFLLIILPSGPSLILSRKGKANITTLNTTHPRVHSHVSCLVEGKSKH